MRDILKNRMWWWVLPIASMFILSYIGAITIEGEPMDRWYNMPLAITYIGLFVGSFWVCLDKIDG